MGGKRHPVFDASDPLLDGRVVAELDLHGYSATEAPVAVRTFLAAWQRRQPGAVVHIITGKGRGSANGPVLRGIVKKQLSSELQSIVAEWGLDDAGGGYKVRVR